MKPATLDDLSSVMSLDELHGKLELLRVNPGWNKPEPAMWPVPRTIFRPAHWKYSQVKSALNAAGRLVNTELAERRTLILANPVENNTYATTRTAVSAYQMIMPGERARSHRHIPNALRLVLDAEPGAYTIVDGEKLMMSPGDIVLTPGWSWHGHGNEGDARAYWVDFLDVPLVQLLEPMFFEMHPEGFETEAAEKPHSPMLFPWSDTQRRLAECSGDPSGPFAKQITLASPSIPTFGLHMMQLETGVTTTPYRMAANNVFAVVQGSGVTSIGNERFEWERGDVIVIPLWHEHWHQATSDAVLFRVTDEDLMRQLGLLRCNS